MHSFDAANNLLTGAIPELWWTPPYMSYLGLDANKLTGTLPGPATGEPATLTTKVDVHGADNTPQYAGPCAV